LKANFSPASEVILWKSFARQAVLGLQVSATTEKESASSPLGLQLLLLQAEHPFQIPGMLQNPCDPQLFWGSAESPCLIQRQQLEATQGSSSRNSQRGTRQFLLLPSYP
jgi:hypothetical protein